MAQTKTGCIYLTNKIRTNKYTCKPAKIINISKLNTDGIIPLTITSLRHKIIEKSYQYNY